MTPQVYAKITEPLKVEPGLYMMQYYTDHGHGQVYIEAHSINTAINRFWSTSGFTPEPLIKRREG